MRWAGTGAELFGVRIDLYAASVVDARYIKTVSEALITRLPFSDGAGQPLAGADAGRGHEGSRVIGLTFMVRADDIGDAARIAADTATSAATAAGIPGPLYDVVVVPEYAMTFPSPGDAIPRPE